MPRPAGSGAKKAPSAHQLAPHFPKGTVLQDLYKQEWNLGEVIGKGGFGLIYLASKHNGSGGATVEDYVIKIEPKENGPLYCEMQFYQRVAKQELIQSYLQKNRLKYLGMPPFIGTGSHTHEGKEYRFLVMNRFGTDLQKLLEDNDGTFNPTVVFAVGLRIIDALQFCHENEYVHADVKAANILLGYSKGKQSSEVYLVDYGLAYRYTVNGNHKAYKEEPKKAHDGTIEFTSRDAHRGVAPSCRGDMEILGYCMLQWLCKKLPWEDNLKDAKHVASRKEKFMSDITKSVTACLQSTNSQSSTNIMKKYFELVKSLNYDESPNYTSFKKILLEGLKIFGQTDEWKIDWGTAKSRKRKSTGPDESVAKKMKSPMTLGRKSKSVNSPRVDKKITVAGTSKGARSSKKNNLLPASAKASPRSPANDAKASKTNLQLPPHTKTVSKSPAKAVSKSPANAARAHKNITQLPSTSITAFKSPAKASKHNIQIPPPTKSTDQGSRPSYLRRRKRVVDVANVSIQTSPLVTK